MSLRIKQITVTATRKVKAEDFGSRGVMVEWVAEKASGTMSEDVAELETIRLEKKLTRLVRLYELAICVIDAEDFGKDSLRFERAEELISEIREPDKRFEQLIARLEKVRG